MEDVLVNSLSTTPQFLVISGTIARYFWMPILFVDLSTQDNIAVEESHLGRYATIHLHFPGYNSCVNRWQWFCCVSKGHHQSEKKQSNRNPVTHKRHSSSLLPQSLLGYMQTVVVIISLD
jgi:hypothetical protein